LFLFLFFILFLFFFFFAFRNTFLLGRQSVFDRIVAGNRSDLLKLLSETDKFELLNPMPALVANFNLLTNDPQYSETMKILKTHHRIDRGWVTERKIEEFMAHSFTISDTYVYPLKGIRLLFCKPYFNQSSLLLLVVSFLLYICIFVAWAFNFSGQTEWLLSFTESNIIAVLISLWLFLLELALSNMLLSDIFLIHWLHKPISTFSVYIRSPTFPPNPFVHTWGILWKLV
jgi:hypothetical protein